LEEEGILLGLDSLGEAPDPPESVAGAHIVVAGGSSEPAWVRIQLLKGETELARCVGRPLAIHHSGPSGRDGFMIEGLHVADTLRGRGWGRYMLGRMHSELRERGYGSAVLGTEPANGPALLLYGNAGYRVICTEWTLERRL
jgi:ribosomal protein S18 acetylase RimI-like enzyme